MLFTFTIGYIYPRISQYYPLLKSSITTILSTIMNHSSPSKHSLIHHSYPYPVYLPCHPSASTSCASAPKRSSAARNGGSSGCWASARKSRWALTRWPRQPRAGWTLAVSGRTCWTWASFFKIYEFTNGNGNLGHLFLEDAMFSLRFLGMGWRCWCFWENLILSLLFLSGPRKEKEGSRRFGSPIWSIMIIYFLGEWCCGNHRDQNAFQKPMKVDQPPWTQTTFTNHLSQRLHQPAFTTQLLHAPLFRQTNLLHLSALPNPCFVLLAKGKRKGGMPKAEWINFLWLFDIPQRFSIPNSSHDQPKITHMSQDGAPPVISWVIIPLTI